MDSRLPSNFLQAMLVAWSVNILKIASEFLSGTSVPSTVRRIERFLAVATRRVGRDGGESPIILASPLECDYTEELYRRRWTLETAFRGLKSAGFNLEDTHLSGERFECMLTLLMIAFAAAFIEGLLKVRELPIPLMKNRQVKRISIFRYGYVNLLHDFWVNVKNSSVMPT